MIERIAWALLALLHALPALAAVQPALLTRLYGVTPADPTFLLLHHRAALFAAIFVICLWAMFDPSVRRMASVVAAISITSFLLLYWVGGTPAPLRSIAIADLIGMPVLAYATWRAFA